VELPPQAVSPPVRTSARVTAVTGRRMARPQAVWAAATGIGPMRRPQVGQSLRSFWAS
jgi:hypothetical protein